VRYGGNTACVEVLAADGTLVVLDAGSGIRRLGATLGLEVPRVDLLLSHLHLDHIQGLGFFRPLGQPGQEVHIWGPPSTTQDLRARLTRYLSPPLFPVRLWELPCRLSLHDVPLEPFWLGGLQVTAGFVCHPGPTLGFRIAEGGQAIAYLPDHEPALGARRFPEAPDWTSGLDLAAGVDLLIHDAQYSAEEYAERVGWGHSAFPHALTFGAQADVKRLVTFHHDPGHDDQTLDRWLAEAHGAGSLPFELLPGLEGASFALGEPPANPAATRPEKRERRPTVSRVRGG
jgi:phosphoribosyl 1,2-cyclic phosphodiesterase